MLRSENEGALAPPMRDSNSRRRGRLRAALAKWRRRVQTPVAMKGLQNKRRVVVLALAATVFAGCGKMGASAEGTEAAEAGAKDEVQKIWDTRCANCHGDEGLGDGPGAVALDPKPRSFADRKWQATITDDKIRTVIVEGGYAVGLSQSMTANPDLRSRPEVVEGLVKKVRGFR